MRKIILTAIVTLLIAGISIAINAKSNGIETEHDTQIAEWEKLAEQGDTAAIHRLIEFFNKNAVEFVEVEAIIAPKGNEVPHEEVEKLNEENKHLAEGSKKYAECLNYWLNKGIAMNDSVALVTKGMRLYYEDEEKAISYLSKAADAGNAQAALFCGSACFNQGRNNEAVKYLTIAYDNGVLSAGWHLAMCYLSGKGVSQNIDKAMECLRHAAELDYPEAVLEMKRIEPNNKQWQHKVDSLEISFPDFPIISNSI